MGGDGVWRGTPGNAEAASFNPEDQVGGWEQVCDD